MFSWRQRRRGMIGIEVRPECLAAAVAGPDGRIGLLDAIDCPAAERNKVLKAWVDDNHLQGLHCNLVLHPDLYTLQLLEKPAVEDNELVDAMRWKVKDMLDYSVDEAVLDVFDFPADALRGKPPLVNVVITRKTLVLELIALIEHCGLSLQSIDITELALRNLIHPLVQDDQATALVLMRETSGMMLLVKQDTVYFSRRLHADMQALTNPEASDRIGQQLALEVQRSMDYFESQMGQKAPRSLLVSAAVNESELIDHLTNILGVDIATIPEQAIGISEDQLAGSLHFVACGGALRKKVLAQPPRSIGEGVAE